MASQPLHSSRETAGQSTLTKRRGEEEMKLESVPPFNFKKMSHGLTIVLQVIRLVDNIKVIDTKVHGPVLKI